MGLSMNLCSIGALTMWFMKGNRVSCNTMATLKNGAGCSWVFLQSTYTAYRKSLSTHICLTALGAIPLCTYRASYLAFCGRSRHTEPKLVTVSFDVEGGNRASER